MKCSICHRRVWILWQPYVVNSSRSGADGSKGFKILGCDHLGCFLQNHLEETFSILCKIKNDIDIKERRNKNGK